MAGKRKKKADKGETGQLGAVVQGISETDPDWEMEHHADQLLHHAAKRSRGYKKARRHLIQQAKRTMRSQNFQLGDRRRGL